MIDKISRNYLAIESLEELKEASINNSNYNLKLDKINDFQLNKFFYKQIGKKYRWVDRLQWTNQNWINYVSNKNLFTFVLKDKKDLVGYFELIYHESKKEIEVAYFGILEEYFGQKLGGYLLSEAIKKSFTFDTQRVWAHTCSLDHQNALKNYIARGMKIFKSETLKTNFY
ncbi:GNAT family N-acetyltransferase [Candidatus Pelagibacter sp.]|nr:GNAT family N-acetyltransferase [Candidatus Pelagibacter sp.]